MREDFLPFSRPSISQGDIEAVSEVLRSGWLTTGPKCAQLEELFAGHTASKAAVAVTSATSAFHLLLHALDIGPGDEVISPSLTWVSLANQVILRGAKLVFADVDRDTLMVGAREIEERISAETKLIVPVHFAGAPYDVDELDSLATRKGIALVQDCAHALGTEYGGRAVGGGGTCVFSLHPIKNITSAEGGVVCLDDVELAQRLRSLRFHGLGVDAHDRRMQGRSPQAEVLEPGYKYNLPDLCAALAIGQFERLEELNRKRAQLAAYYLERLSDVEELLPLAQPAYPMRHAWHLFIVRLDLDKISICRDEFMEELKARNIGTGLHFRAVHSQSYYRSALSSSSPELPNTEWNSDRILSLPLFPDMTLGDVDDVISAIRDVLAGCLRGVLK